MGILKIYNKIDVYSVHSTQTVYNNTPTYRIHFLYDAIALPIELEVQRRQTAFTPKHC